MIPPALDAVLALLPVRVLRVDAEGTVRTVGDDAPPAPLEHALAAPLAAYARRLLAADPGDAADAPPLVCNASGDDAAVLLPLPVPVWTMRRPFSTVFEA